MAIISVEVTSSRRADKERGKGTERKHRPLDTDMVRWQNLRGAINEEGSCERDKVTIDEVQGRPRLIASKRGEVTGTTGRAGAAE